MTSVRMFLLRLMEVTTRILRLSARPSMSVPGEEKQTYSVTQSYENSFWDVVLDTLNNVSRDKLNILDQIYTSKYVLTLIVRI